MRNLLALAAAVVVAVAAVGWYRGWYSIGMTRGISGHEKVTVDINTPKVNADIHKGEGKVQQVLENKVQGTTEPVPHPHGSHHTFNVQVPPTSVTPGATTEFVLPGANERNFDVNVNVPVPGTDSGPRYP